MVKSPIEKRDIAISNFKLRPRCIDSASCYDLLRQMRVRSVSFTMCCATALKSRATKRTEYEHTMVYRMQGTRVAQSEVVPAKIRQ